jgi:MarR family transcriptional regulator, organic hydroperoxide resistance regulator
MSKPAAHNGGRDPLRLDRQVCFPLYAASNLIQRLYRPLLAPLGLTYSRYLVMLALWEREPASVGELCACPHLDVGTLSPLLKRMEQAGFVTRPRDRRDDRKVIVALTPHGRALRQDALAAPKTLAKQIAMRAQEAERLRLQTQTLVDKLAPVAA